MAREHEPVNSRTRRTRRPIHMWDRVKILILIGVLFLLTIWTKINDPFTSFSEASEEILSGAWGAFLVLVFSLEILRQLHYFVGEHWGSYNQMWSEKFFGGAERVVQKRTKPWTRFRIARWMRILFFLFIYGSIVSAVSPDADNPLEAILITPSFIGQYAFFIVYGIFIMTIVVGQFVAIFWFLSRGGIDVVLPEEIETRYEDVWGQDHVLELVKENVGFLEKPDEIEAKGGYIPGGMLLWGPPGTGKTLIAEATAGEVGVPFVFIEPGAFIQMFMGVGILKVKRLFRKLRKLSIQHGGVIAFFDEADALGNRGSLGGSAPGQPMIATHDRATCNGAAYLSSASLRHLADEAAANHAVEAEGRGTFIDRIMMGGMGMGGGGGTLQALLTEMSGLTKPRGLVNKIRKGLGMKPKLPPKYRIFIMMASNMPQSLDEALLRPGRIDRIYRVGYPSREGRLATFGGYLNKVDHDLSDEQVEDLAVKTPHYSGAKIKDLVNEALILAMRDDREVVTFEDLRKAKRLKELGPPEDTEYIERERHAIAVHEACHAAVGHLVKSHRVIDIATIERHSSALGLVSSIALEDRVTQWRTEYEADIMTSIASLAGEKLFFGGDNSSGVSGDLSTATRLAAYMQGLFGMGSNVMSLSLMSTGRFGSGEPTPDVLKMMRSDVEEILEGLLEETTGMLEEHKDKVLAIAAALEDRKTITGDEIAEIMEVPAGSYTVNRRESWTLIDPQRALDAAGLSGTAAATPDPVSIDTADEVVDD